MMKQLLTYACIFLIGSVSFGASSATLILMGTVSSTYSISVTSQTAATNLDIVGGETNKLVGVTTEITNNVSGFKVMLSSANGGQLKNGTQDFVQYQVSYNGASAVTPTTNAQQVKTYPSATLAGVQSNITVSFTGKPTALSGSYSDTLTLSIVAP